MNWSPQAPLTAFQGLAAGVFVCFFRYAFLKKVCFSEYLLIFGVFTYLGKHQMDAECNAMQNNSRLLS